MKAGATTTTTLKEHFNVPQQVNFESKIIETQTDYHAGLN